MFILWDVFYVAGFVWLFCVWFLHLYSWVRLPVTALSPTVTVKFLCKAMLISSKELENRQSFSIHWSILWKTGILFPWMVKGILEAIIVLYFLEFIFHPVECTHISKGTMALFFPHLHILSIWCHQRERSIGRLRGWWRKLNGGSDQESQFNSKARW